MLYVADMYAILFTVIWPVGCSIYLCIKNTGYLSRIGLGALMYIILEMILKLPLLTSLLSVESVAALFHQHPLLYALLLGLLEAVFMVCITWVVFRFFFGLRDTPKDALAYGVGFGGCQALLLVGIPAVSILISGAEGISASSLFLSGTEQISLQILIILISLILMDSVQKHSWKLFLLCFLVVFMIYCLSYALLSVLQIPAVVWQLILLAVMAAAGYWYLKHHSLKTDRDNY